MKYLTIIILFTFIYCTHKDFKIDGYEMPKIIQELIELQEAKIYNGEEFEFWIDFQKESRYSICPIDAIPFASTGNNGIHFAFLTDFGRNKNLRNAPIVCIAPSYDPPVNLVSNNLEEFLSIVTTIENSTLLASRYKSQVDFDRRKEEWFNGFLSKPRISESRKKLATLLKEKFKLKEINQIVAYSNDIRNERAQNVDYPSMDGLGVFKLNNEKLTEFNYSKNPQEVFKFLSNSNRNSRLLFYRNSYFNYILSKDYDEAIKFLIIQYLKKDGFLEEAKRLQLSN